MTKLDKITCRATVLAILIFLRPSMDSTCQSLQHFTNLEVSEQPKTHTMVALSFKKQHKHSKHSSKDTKTLAASGTPIKQRAPI